MTTSRKSSTALATTLAALLLAAPGWAQTAQTGGQTGGGQGGQGDQGPQFFLNDGSFFDALDGFIETSADRVELSTVLDLFRYFEE